MKKNIIMMLALFIMFCTDSLGALRREELCKRELRNGLLCLKGEKDPYTGVLVSYYEDNSIEALMSYKEGLLDGSRVLYYRNGLIKSKENYVEGLKEGVTFLYYENGQVMVKTDYQNGKKDGEKVHYYRNGKVKSRTSFKNGRRYERLTFEDTVVKDSDENTL